MPARFEYALNLKMGAVLSRRGGRRRLNIRGRGRQGGRDRSRTIIDVRLIVVQRSRIRVHEWRGARHAGEFVATRRGGSSHRASRMPPVGVAAGTREGGEGIGGTELQGLRASDTGSWGGGVSRAALKGDKDVDLHAFEETQFRQCSSTTEVFPADRETLGVRWYGVIGIDDVFDVEQGPRGVNIVRGDGVGEGLDQDLKEVRVLLGRGRGGEKRCRGRRRGKGGPHIGLHARQLVKRAYGASIAVGRHGVLSLLRGAERAPCALICSKGISGVAGSRA
jgi:hypothetical protein